MARSGLGVQRLFCLPFLSLFGSVSPDFDRNFKKVTPKGVKKISEKNLRKRLDGVYRIGYSEGASKERHKRITAKASRKTESEVIQNPCSLTNRYGIP